MRTKAHEVNIHIKKAISDFRSGLRKFYAFITSDFENLYNDAVTSEIEKTENSTALSVTEKETIIKARVGQGRYRRELINYWKGCSISHCDMIDLLTASHIKPWVYSSNSERIDKYNGFLLLPNYDKLFDLGYITVDVKGNIITSELLTDDYKQLFRVIQTPKIRIEEQHKPYLDYHNQNCFMG